jgi:hypothetical protein
MKVILKVAFFILPATVFSQVWQQTATTPEGSGVTDMLVRESNQHIFVATGSFDWPSGDLGGVRRSTDDGATWENLNDVFVARTIIDGADGNLYSSIWDFPQDEGLYRSTDNGNNWGNALVTVPSGDNIFSIAVNTTTIPNTIFAGTRNGPLRSTDNGVNWAPVINGIPQNSWVRDIEVDSGGYVVAATTNGMFTSTNNGDVWEQASGIAVGDTIVKIIFDYPLVTENAGGSTRLLGGSDDGNIYESFRESKYLTSTLIAIFGGSEISGMFIMVLQTQNEKVHGVSTFPKGSEGGFYLSSDNGTSWQQNNQGLPSNPKTSALSGFKLSASIKYHIGTFDNMNGGAKIFSLDYSTSDVEPISTSVPDDYKLLQNYPNPFNPNTTIQFSVPEEGFVTLDIFSSLGEKISTLISENLNAGTYKYDWNAADLPSGIYFYRLTAERFKRTRKLVLMK